MRDASRDHVGDRFVWWNLDDAPDLTPQQQARCHEAFATEFESLPPDQEPDEGWGETMAYLCRRVARRLRGEPVGEWVPSWERQHRRGDRAADGRVHQAS